MIELIQEILFGVSNPNQHLAIASDMYTYYEPKYNLSVAWMAIAGLAQAAAGYDWGGKRRKAKNRARQAYEDQKDIYKGLDTSNAFADLENRYEGMENTMEDLTVNKQQAQFEKEMFQQQQASTMSQLRGAAGSSGVAGLAQAMANQGITQAQKASASIGQQEAKNKLLAAQEASRIEQLERAGASTVDQLKAKGELSSMQMEQSKQATILGMDAQAYTGAQQAVLQGQQMVAQGLSTVAGSYDPLTKTYR